LNPVYSSLLVQNRLASILCFPPNYTYGFEELAVSKLGGLRFSRKRRKFLPDPFVEYENAFDFDRDSTPLSWLFITFEAKKSMNLRISQSASLISIYAGYNISPQLSIKVTVTDSRKT